MPSLWAVVGAALVTLSFLLPSRDNIWSSLNTAGIVAAIYLAALMTAKLRQPFSVRARLLTWIIFLCTTVGILFFSNETYTATHWQQDNLLKARGKISRGILMSEMQPMLLKVLHIHEQQPPAQRESLRKIFQRLHPSCAVGGDMRLPASEADSLRIFLGWLSESQITLIGQEMYVKGRNPWFKNYHDKSGMIQESCTLTEEGVRYESEN